ncbi:MAG: hypothetical protein QNJ12_02325 [Ilumatobacter sp.]|uniref:hypothetical protein n=1 Tax=Ilumatobacter sp. TaxID=1967498 RepID=UPI00261AB2E0|nr:hypothetical protein [Ilumatobacter sp.]MDJ0767593.1 hypothetical protein [Ilumatobacter sp.]
MRTRLFLVAVASCLGACGGGDDPGVTATDPPAAAESGDAPDAGEISSGAPVPDDVCALVPAAALADYPASNPRNIGPPPGWDGFDVEACAAEVDGAPVLIVAVHADRTGFDQISGGPQYVDVSIRPGAVWQTDSPALWIPLADGRLLQVAEALAAPSDDPLPELAALAEAVLAGL